MKTTRFPFLAAIVALLFGAGCGSLDLAPGGDSNRVLNGTVNVGTGLPAGAEVAVRIIATSAANEPARSAGNDVPVMTRPATPVVERVLGEHAQVLKAGTAEPVSFRIEYTADDAMLRRGLNVEARVSFGGKLRYRTVNAHVVTLASSAYRQEVAVQPVAR